MSKPNPSTSKLKRLWIWAVSFAIAGGILVLGAVALLAFMVHRARMGVCPNEPFPPLEQARPLAQAQFESVAKEFGMPAGRFFLKDVHANVSKAAIAWEFVFQVKDDIERPRQIRIVVDPCPHAHDATDSFMGW